MFGDATLVNAVLESYFKTCAYFSFKCMKNMHVNKCLIDVHSLHLFDNIIVNVKNKMKRGLPKFVAITLYLINGKQQELIFSELTSPALMI